MAVPRVKEVLECIPFVDEIIEYDEEGRHRLPWAKINLIWQLRRKHFDIAFLLHRSLTRALLVYFAGIPQRVGYDEKKRGVFLTHKVEPLACPVHRSDHYLNVIESTGVPVEDRSCHMSVTPKAKEEINLILANNNIQTTDYLVVLHPGGNWNLKRWPPGNFSKLTFEIPPARDVKIVISGTHKEQHLSQRIKEGSFNTLIDLTGQTDLKQLMALMQRADLVISADSGPLHLASGVGCDVIGLYGPTRPEITGPRGCGRIKIIQHDVGCNREACYHLKCSDNICMQSITVNDVLKSIKHFRNS